MSPCTAPVSWEELVAYWAGDLDATDVDRLDEHLMGCAQCTRESARVAAITETIRAFIPPLLDHAQLAALRARGLRIKENVIHPGERAPVIFDLKTDILLHRLGGLDLTSVEQVVLKVVVEDTDVVLIDEPRAPFDRDSGELLIACQRHFAALPPNIVIEVRARELSGRETTARFAIPHIYESAES